MSDEQPPSLVNLEALLQASQPRPRANWLWYAAGLFLLLLLSSTFAAQAPGAKSLVQILTTTAMLAVVAGLGLLTWLGVRRAREEQRQIEALEELVQLRRWQEALAVSASLLSRPTRAPQARLLGLLFLVKILARYHQWADVVTLCEYLIGADILDPDTTHVLRLERAMAMLQEDRLFDADRAINELRRMDQARESAGLALLEIYRDVKTGHLDDALAAFDSKRDLMRRGLGYRVGDAHALAARAHDLLGHAGAAQQAYGEATVLVPEVELHRRYPEVAAMKGRFAAATAPTEAAA